LLLAKRLAIPVIQLENDVRHPQKPVLSPTNSPGIRIFICKGWLCSSPIVKQPTMFART
jgi:hypothetical protein